MSKQRSFEHFWVILLSAVAAVMIIFLTAMSGSAFIGYRFYVSTQEQYNSLILTLRSFVPRDNLKMFDVNGIPIGQLMDRGLHTSVTYDQIAQNMINATVSTEDKDSGQILVLISSVSYKQPYKTWKRDMLLRVVAQLHNN